MAARCSSYSAAVAAMATTTTMMMMMMMMTPGSVASSVECPSGLVYPSGSTCWDPATYEGIYELAAAPGTDAEGSLAPEWDETNSTYYVRLAHEGAKYFFSYLSRELRFAVAQSEDLIIGNVESGRTLGWRQEGDEYFLVEETLKRGLPPNFQFSKADISTLPCRRTVDARCEAYHILNFRTSVGLTPYEEDGATYFKLSDSSGALPFVLRRSTTTSSTTTA